MLPDKLKRLSPEKYLIAFLVVIEIEGFLNNSFGLMQLIVSPAVAAAADFAAKYMRYKTKKFPEHGLITGLIIALVMSPLNIFASLLVPLAAVILKNVVRYKARNVFNPAALAMFVSAPFIAAAWWAVGSFLTVLIGILVAYKIRRLHNAISFIVALSAISFVNGFVNSGAFLLPLNAIMLFFAFVMVIEPVTSPYTKKGQVVFGASVAALSFLFGIFSSLDMFLASLLLMNLFTPWLNRLK